MNYSQERKASEEILRMVIQKMAAHPAAFTPSAYAVWYEYIMGINPGLDQAVKQLLDNKALLDDDAISRLYENHVSDSRWEVSVLREGMKQVLGKLMDATAESNKQTQSFGSSLQTFGNVLRAKPDPLVLDTLTSRMASDTEAMHGSVTQLHTDMMQCKIEVKRLQQELESARQEALIDPLTGVYNRRGFEIQAQSLLGDKAAISNGACLMMLDIDRFKMINDNYGHLFGDKVICTLANTLKATVKGQDSVCRMGGEEFAILLPLTPLAGAAQLAEHIRKSIEHGKIKSPLSDVQVDTITVSIGVAAYQHGNNIMQWLDLADKALYQSKQGGRNRVTVHERSET